MDNTSGVNQFSRDFDSETIQIASVADSFCTLENVKGNNPEVEKDE